MYSKIIITLIKLLFFIINRTNRNYFIFHYIWIRTINIIII